MPTLVWGFLLSHYGDRAPFLLTIDDEKSCMRFCDSIANGPRLSSNFLPIFKRELVRYTMPWQECYDENVLRGCRATLLSFWLHSF